MRIAVPLFLICLGAGSFLGASHRSRERTSRYARIRRPNLCGRRGARHCLGTQGAGRESEDFSGVVPNREPGGGGDVETRRRGVCPERGQPGGAPVRDDRTVPPGDEQRAVEVEIQSQDDDWSAPVVTSLTWADPANARVWAAWADPIDPQSSVKIGMRRRRGTIRWSRNPLRT